MIGVVDFLRLRTDSATARYPVISADQTGIRLKAGTNGQKRLYARMIEHPRLSAGSPVTHYGESVQARLRKARA
jgi:hypothetical protein